MLPQRGGDLSELHTGELVGEVVEGDTVGEVVGDVEGEKVVGDCVGFIEGLAVGAHVA